MLDLSRIPLTDVHCHPLSTEYASVTRVADLQGLVALGATGTAPYPAFDVEHSFTRRQCRLQSFRLQRTVTRVL